MSELSDKIILYLREKLSGYYSEGSLPYTYHHDFLRTKGKYVCCSRAEVASAEEWSVDNLYALAFLQIINDILIFKEYQGLLIIDAEGIELIKECIPFAENYI